MEDYVEYSVRPGHFGLSFVSLGGLALLAASLWVLAPGFVILLLIPALAACIWQMCAPPVYGLRMGPTEWAVLDGTRDRTVDFADIAYMRLSGEERAITATIVLTSDEEVELPISMTAEPLSLIRDVTARGVPIRTY